MMTLTSRAAATAFAAVLLMSSAAFAQGTAPAPATGAPEHVLEPEEIPENVVEILKDRPAEIYAGTCP